MVHTKTHAIRLFGVFVIVLNSLNIALCNVESDALLVQLAALTDPHKVLASWINSFPDPCHWFHVHCDESGHVIIVDLSFEDMSGHIVHELGQLTHLRRLYLNNNCLTGGIPESLTTISTLTQLDLSNNNLCGLVPSEGSFEKFGPKSFAGNRQLCGPTVDRQCGWDCDFY